MDNKKRLTIGFLIGMIAISVTSLSFSIAWYASSNFLRVDPIDIAIECDRSIKISPTTNPEDFKEHLDTDSGALNKIPMFAPVSSIKSEDWILQRASTPMFYDCARYWGAPGEPDMDPIRADDNYYFSQELYLYADDDVYLTLDTENTYLKTDEAANTVTAQKYKNENPEVTWTVEEIKEKLDQLNKAMRFSILIPGEDFYQYYIIDPNRVDDTKVYFGGVLDNSKNQYYDSYTFDSQFYETVYGDIKNRDKIVYDEPLAEDTELIGEPSAFNAKHMANTHPLNFQKTIENGAEIATENSLTLGEIADNQNLLRFPVYHGYSRVRKIVLSIYIEGWDLRSINSTMGSSFTANLAFKILREM